MSNPSKDAINDRMDSDWSELLDEYVWDKKGLDEFVDWLFDVKNNKEREKLLDKFGDSNEGKRFRDWAWRVTEDRMQMPDDDSREDR